MSSDLQNAFGAFSNIPGRNSTSQGHNNEITADVDDFGDFEEPENRGEGMAPPHSLHTSQYTPIFTTAADSTSEDPSLSSAIQEVKGLSGDEDGWGDFVGDSVLFDADRASAMDEVPSDRPQAAFDQHRKQKGLKVTVLPIDQRGARPAPAKPVTDNDSKFVDFGEDEIWEPINIVNEPITPEKVSASAMSLLGLDNKPKPHLELEPKSNGPPPSNIPPPSVLLPIVTRLFQSLPMSIKTIVNTQGASEALGKPQIDQLQETLAAVRAGARIIAGRKLRWKRDNILAQSVKIGQASSKSSGMKLTGLDKTESRREDQEATEALAVWKKQIGLLRSAVTTVNVHAPGGALAFLDVSENMPIRVIKPSEGAITAPKACFLCGIKRDERITKIDIDVEDSFGEWWAEHWGHVDCMVFWENHQSSLPRR